MPLVSAASTASSTALPTIPTAPVGASLTAVMPMVTLAEAVCAPPEPVLPPSSTLKVNVSEAGGASLLIT